LYFWRVKKLLKITAILSISILYCLITSLYSVNAMNYYTDYSKHSNLQYYSSIVSSNLFCHTEQTEGASNIYNNISRTSLKNSFNQFSACSFAPIQLLNNLYSPYIYFSENLTVRFMKTDIIFPFHNFW
jgi:hypothetical protein